MIRYLKVEDFQGAERVEIELGPRTLVVGDNGEGKSSAFEALDFLVSGEPTRGGVMNDVIRHGATSTSIEITLDDPAGTTLTRRRNESKTTLLVAGDPVKEIEYAIEVRRLIGDPRAFRAALRSGSVLEMEADDLQRYLVGWTGAKFGAEEIGYELGGDVIDAAKRHNLRLPTSIEPKSWSGCEDAAVEAGKVAKRTVVARKGDYDRAPKPTREEERKVTSIETSIAKLRTARAEAERKATAASADVLARRDERLKRLRADIADDEKSLAAAKERLAALGTPRDVAVVDAELTDARAKAAAGEYNVVAHQRAIDALTESAPPTDADTALAATLADASADEQRARENHNIAIALRDRELPGLRRDIAILAADIARLEAIVATEAPTQPSDAADALTLDARRDALEDAIAAKEQADRVSALHGAKVAAVDRLLELAPEAGTCTGACEHCTVANAAANRRKLEADLADARAHADAAREKVTAANKAVTEARQSFDLAEAAMIRTERAAARVVAEKALAQTRTTHEKLVADEKAHIDRGAAFDKAMPALVEATQRARAAAGRIQDARSLAEHRANIERERAAAKAEREREATLTTEIDTARKHALASAVVVEKGELLPERRAELARLEAEAAPQPPETGVDVLDKRIADEQAALEAARARDVRNALGEKLDAAELVVKEIVKVAKALGKDGAKKTLIARGCATFLNAANESLALFAPEWTIGIDPAEFGIVLTQKEGTCRPKQLSDGHRTRLGHVLQPAIAKLAKIPFVVFDRVEFLDEKGMATMDALLASCAGAGIQSVLLTCDPDYRLDGVPTYIMRNGRSVAEHAVAA
jgi:hypothetical protein